MAINQTFRNLNRTREIIGILIKYGFEDVVMYSTLRNLVPESARLKWLRDNKPITETTRYERIRMAVVELGPTFVKIAQILSNRPDMIPEGLMREFEKLQTRVPPFDSKIAMQIVEREIGKPINEVFEEFSEVPLASASIGQVHKGKLKTGEMVVVKVQRPNVADLMERDLNIIKDIVRRADRYLRKQGIMNAEDVVNTFDRALSKELDYKNEARNIDRFRTLYRHRRDFYIPKAYREYSTERVLILEYVEGCRITDLEQLKKWNISPKDVVERGMDIYLTQIFEYGYFHGDPHPGNVLVREDGTIVLLDFGMIGQLMPKDKQAFAGVFIAMARHDAREMAIQMRNLAIEDNITDMRQFTYEMNELIEDYASLDVSEASIQDVINRLQKLMYIYRITVPGGVFIVFRAFAILEGIGKIMYPNFKTYDFIRPYGQRLLTEQLKPANLANEAATRFSSFYSLLSSLPAELKNILAKTNNGKIHFEIELQGYGYALKKWDSITNRIVLTFILCALLLGSSIAMLGHYDSSMQYYYGINAFSFIGFCISGGLFVILMYIILRRRVYK